MGSGIWCYPCCWRRNILPALTPCGFKEGISFSHISWSRNIWRQLTQPPRTETNSDSLSIRLCQSNVPFTVPCTYFEHTMVLVLVKCMAFFVFFQPGDSRGDHMKQVDHS